MPKKTILLYDTANEPLRVIGIDILLLDAVGGGTLDRGLSQNLDPSKPDHLSEEWGVNLDFPSGRTPLDLLIQDQQYRYPGNSILSLNGELQDRVFIDLHTLPQHVGGQYSALNSGELSELIGFVESAPDWSEEDKEAVFNLVFSYMRVVVARPNATRESADLQRLAVNWEGALRRIGIEPELFQPAKSTRSGGGGQQTPVYVTVEENVLGSKKQSRPSAWSSGSHSTDRRGSYRVTGSTKQSPSKTTMTARQKG